MATALEEARDVMGGAVRELLEKTGARRCGMAQLRPDTTSCVC